VCGNLDADPALEVAIDNGDIYEFTGFTLHKQGAVDNVADGTPQYAGSADIDGDGNDELFVVYGEVGVVRVQNLESAAPSWTVNTGSRILAARVVDINRDGVKDLLVVTLRGDNTGEIVGFNGVNGHELVRIATPDPGVFAINAGNFDNDAGTEIAVALFRPFSRPNRLYIYNAATGALKWRSEDEVGPITAASMHDLDRDGQPEVVVAVRGVYGVGDIRLLAFDANTFQRRWATSHQILPVTGSGEIASLAMGDVDGDGDDEIVIGMQKDGIAQVVVLDGATRTFLRMIPLTGFQYVEALALHDFDGDGDEEIVAAASAPYPSEYGGEVFMLDGANGQTVAHGGLGTYHSRHLTAVRVGDVTGDGHADIVAAGASVEGFGGVVFIMDGVTHAVRGEVGGAGFEGLALVDVNGDGVLEIALGSSSGALDVRRAADLASLRTLAPCTTPIHAISTNSLPGALPGQVFYSCDDRVGSADLRAGGAAQGMTGMVGYRVGNGNVLLATGTAAAPRLTTTTILGLRHLTPSANTAVPYIVPGNHEGPAVYAAERNATMTGNILFGNFSGRPTQLELVEGPQSGQFTLANGVFTYRPTAVRSVDNFTVRATDGVSQSVPMTFSILIRNSAPIVPYNSEFTATQGQPLVTASGTRDLDGDNMQFTLVTAPTKGSLIFRVDGSFTYTPSATATGDDNFEYSASDSLRASGNNGAVVIHIQAAVPTPPTPPTPTPQPPAPPSGGGGGGGAFDYLSLLLLLCALGCAQRRDLRLPSARPFW
jgi:outer membrane protein assembly factor BamB